MSKNQSASEKNEMNRDQVIIRTSIIGILANVLLAVFKALIGVASHSIAVILDAVNNLSDALSSIITIVGTKLAGKLHVDIEAKEMTFDVVMNFDIRPQEGLAVIYKELQQAYPEYRISIAPDVDVSVTG